MTKTEFRPITKQTRFIIGGTCDNCGAELELSYGPVQWSGPDSELFKGILPIQLIGQYSGYFDKPDLILHFCKICADKLCIAFPCFRDVIEKPEEEQCAGMTTIKR